MESPSAPSSPPPSRPDALDDLEARVVRSLREGAEPAWGDLLAAIERAEQGENAIYPEPPPIDPSEGRRSTAELRCLIETLRGPARTLPLGATRAGYTLEGAPGGEARAHPAFAAAIDDDRASALFPDLWALDAALFRELGRAEARELARLWLESPGRRLVQDMRVLRALPGGGKTGASDLSSARLDAAIGLDLEDAPRPHRELHLAIPGAALDAWEPEPKDPGKQVLHALRLLEEGSPISLRGAALAWLLDRAADDPFYTLDEIRRDLREDLPVRLTWALTTWMPDSGAGEIPRRLEALSLTHAAHIVAADRSEKAARRGWAIARWIQACLRRSPFYGADEEVLATHLRARLPIEPPSLAVDADAMHPARFAIDGSGLDIAATAFMAGVLAHYQRDPKHTLLPTPEPLVHWLQRISTRPVRAPEEAADAALAAGRNALGWPEDYAIAPALAARQLMTHLHISWLAQVGKEAQLDSLDRFASEADRFGWVALAVEREGHRLSSEVRERAIEVFEALSAAGSAPPRFLAAFGAGLLEGLREEHIPSLFDLATRAEANWRPYLLDSIAGAAERAGRDAVWKMAVDGLIALMQAPGIDERHRLNAGLFAMRRASASKLRARDASLKQIAALAASPPFTDHLGVRREIQRLGLTLPAAAGTKR